MRHSPLAERGGDIQLFPMGSQSSISVDLPQYRSSHKSRFLAVKAKEKTVFWRGICIGIACTLFLVGGFYLAKRMENNSGTAMAPTYNLDRTVHQPPRPQHLPLQPRLESSAAQTTGKDPYLAYRPSFTYSLPVQVLIQGITLTLLAVLLIHILFTTQYHFPLSKFNYLLQLSGILLVLGSIIGSIVVVMAAQERSSTHWPYMLDYISVNTPPSTWSKPQKGAWFFLQSLCNGMVHLTHIQFLTLLFPSATEVKLIFLLLGPLALAASGLTFSSLSDRRTTIDLGDAIRNVFDGTLLLIFSVSLVIWGLLVNRKRAWRFDGGTAAFGAGATILAIISTAINFVEVKEDTINWLQNLLWAIVLWQSWLGFWWWVGSGMGVGEVEDMVQKEQKKKLRIQRRREERRRLEAANISGEDGPTGTTTALDPLRLRVERPRGRSRVAELPDNTSGAEDIELREIGEARSPGNGGPVTTGGSSSSSDASPLPLESVSGIFAYPINLILRYVRNLRSGHEEATKRKVLRRAKLRQQVFEGQNAAASEGWGLGSFGIREAEDSERRLSAANRIARNNQTADTDADELEEDDEDVLSPGSDLEAGRARRPVQDTGGVTSPEVPRDGQTPAVDDRKTGGVKGWLKKWRLVDRSTY